MNFRRIRREELVISVTPMIDVVFLLLIFFMVTTTFNRETALEIELPEAQGKQQAEEKVLEISIDTEGRYFVNKHEVVNRKVGTLIKAIREATSGQKQPPVVISADAETSHQAVISALDALSQVGFVHITFATKTPPGSE